MVCHPGIKRDQQTVCNAFGEAQGCAAGCPFFRHTYICISIVRPVGLAYVTYTQVKREFASELVPNLHRQTICQVSLAHQNWIGNTTHAMQKSHIGAVNKVNHDIQAHTAICNADEGPEQPGRIRWSTYQRPACHVQNQAREAIYRSAIYREAIYREAIYRSQRGPEEGEVELIRVMNDQASMRTPAPKIQKHGSQASITKDRNTGCTPWGSWNSLQL